MAGITSFGLNAREKISKVKYDLYKSSPFFSFIIEYFIFQEDKNVPTMGVNKSRTFYYNEEFVKKLTMKELVGCVVHEAIHKAYEHIDRQKGRMIMVGQHSLWNLACDIVANNILVLNDFTLPEEGMIPRDNQYTFLDHVVEDISSKAVEDIYEELKAVINQKLKEQKQNGSGNGDSDGEEGQGQGASVYDPNEELKQGVGSHEKWSEGESDQESKDKADGTVEQKPWKEIVNEAATVAKMRGTVPNGMEREFGQLYKSKVHWKAILRHEVAKRIPQDLTMSRPNRKFIGEDIYLPSIKGETIKILIAMDTSGSVTPQDMTSYMSEIVAISKSFSSVEFRLLTHDIEVHDDLSVRNGNIKKILKMKPRGGGGTSHIPLYEYIKYKRYIRDAKLLVSFTDGWSDYPEKIPVRTVFVLTGGHCDPAVLKKYGKVLTVKN